MNQFRVLPTSL